VNSGFQEEISVLHDGSTEQMRLTSELHDKKDKSIQLHATVTELQMQCKSQKKRFGA